MRRFLHAGPYDGLYLQGFLMALANAVLWGIAVALGFAPPRLAALLGASISLYIAVRVMEVSLKIDEAQSCGEVSE